MYSPVEPPKYRQIMTMIKSQISTGALGPGDRLPTVRELAETWNVSHATATKAQRELCREGYAHVVGNATYVRDRGPDLTVKRLLWGSRSRAAAGRLGYGEFGGPAQLPGWVEITAAGLVPAPSSAGRPVRTSRATRTRRPRPDRMSCRCTGIRRPGPRSARRCW
jgi:hypothetical protein